MKLWSQEAISHFLFETIPKHRRKVDLVVTVGSFLGVLVLPSPFNALMIFVMGAWNFHEGVMTGGKIMKRVCDERTSEGIGDRLRQRLESMPPGQSLRIEFKNGGAFTVAHADDYSHVCSLANLKTVDLPTTEKNKHG